MSSIFLGEFDQLLTAHPIRPLAFFCWCVILEQDNEFRCISTDKLLGCECPHFDRWCIIHSRAVIKLYQWQRAERSEKTGVWGRIPQEVRWLTSRSFGSGCSVWVGKGKLSFWSQSSDHMSRPTDIFKKGSTKLLSLHFCTRFYSEDIFDALPNFLFLEDLSAHIESISSHELTSLVQSVPQIRPLWLVYQRVSGYANGASETINWTFADMAEVATLRNIVADIVEHSPDLVCLSIRGTIARKEWTMKN
jgi:hypothetical protein